MPWLPHLFNRACLGFIQLVHFQLQKLYALINKQYVEHFQFIINNVKCCSLFCHQTFLVQNSLQNSDTVSISRHGILFLLKGKNLERNFFRINRQIPSCRENHKGVKKWKGKQNFCEVIFSCVGQRFKAGVIMTATPTP